MSKTKHDFITDFLFEVNGQFHQPDYDMLDSFYDLMQKEYEEKHRWIPVEEKEPPLNEQVILKYDTDEYCIGVLTVYGFYLQPFDPIENDFGSIFLAGTVNAWRSFL